MISNEPWQFKVGELPEWAQPPDRPSRADDEPSFTVPAPTPPPIVTILGQMFLARLTTLGLFALLTYFGSIWVSDGKVLRYALMAAAGGFALGALIYLWMLKVRIDEERLTRMKYQIPLTQPSLFDSFVVIPAIGPLFVLAAASLYLVFANRYTGLLFLASACGVAFYRLGANPIRFALEKLSTNYVVNIDERPQWLATEQRPDLGPLLTCLLLVFLVPAYFSTTLGIVAVVGYVTTQLTRRFRALQRYGPFPLVAAAVLMRAQTVGHDYYAYVSTDQSHWIPKLPRSARRFILRVLLGTTDLVLLVGLTGFFPWELFASLTVPGFDFPAAAFAHYPTYDFNWILVPVKLIDQAEPRELYIASLVVAVPLFILLPPCVLLLTYFSRLIDLENFAQEIKRRWNA